MYVQRAIGCLGAGISALRDGDTSIADDMMQEALTVLTEQVIDEDRALAANIAAIGEGEPCVICGRFKNYHNDDRATEDYGAHVWIAPEG